ncbi:MAG: hypothetical protein PHX51_02770 [Clostridia bacterium]|nr:hypothetical protein [Clostridia bacterium]
MKDDFDKEYNKKFKDDEDDGFEFKKDFNNGNIHVSVEKDCINLDDDEVSRRHRVKRWYRFPYPMFIVLAFLLLGFLADAWNVAWVLFLTIPIYYAGVTVALKKHFRGFPYTLLCIVIYLLLGLIFGDKIPYIWAWGLLIFATVPVYYMVVRKKNFWKNFPYVMLCVIVFLVLGFTLDAWHPGWVVFLTIPIFYSIVDMVKY